MVWAARIVVIFTAETEILNHHRISAGLRTHTEKPTGPVWDRPVTKYSLAQFVHSQAHPRHIDSSAEVISGDSDLECTE